MAGSSGEERQKHYNTGYANENEKTELLRNGSTATGPGIECCPGILQTGILPLFLLPEICTKGEYFNTWWPIPAVSAHALHKDDDGGQIILIRKDCGRAGSMAGRTLKKTIRESIVAILTRYGAERIAIFGSYARGEAGGRSDIDILVRFARPKPDPACTDRRRDQEVYPYERRSRDREGCQPPYRRFYSPR